MTCQINVHNVANNKNYPVSPGQHIFIIFVSFERQMNKAINKTFDKIF